MALPTSALATLIIAGTAITGTTVAVIARHPGSSDQNSKQVQVVDQQPVAPNGKIKVLEPSPLPSQTSTPTPTFSNSDDGSSNPGSWNNGGSDDDQSWNGDDNENDGNNGNENHDDDSGHQDDNGDD